MKTMSSMVRPLIFEGRCHDRSLSSDYLARNRIRVRDGSKDDFIRIALGSVGFARSLASRSVGPAQAGQEFPTGTGCGQASGARARRAPLATVDPDDAGIPAHETSERDATSAAAAAEPLQVGGDGLSTGDLRRRRRLRGRAAWAQGESEGASARSDAQDEGNRSRRFRTSRARDAADQKPRTATMTAKVRSALHSAARSRKIRIDWLHPG